MIESELHKRYPSGCRVTNKELKQILQMLYNAYGIKAVATATDITRYGYSTRACSPYRRWKEKWFNTNSNMNKF